MVLYNKMIDTIYIVPTWHCNLNCPHCYVHFNEDGYIEDSFIYKLKELKSNYPEAHFILHGGEPTLYKDRYNLILNTGIIDSICSNLIIDSDIIEDFNNRDILISTSWNPNRFDKQQYQLWLNNINKLLNKPLILITLDQDLIKYNISNFIRLLKDLENVGVQDILFEPLVDNNLDDEFQNKVDEWLCNIHNIWINNNIKLHNKIEEQILNWNFRCKTLTLYPNGIVKKGCILGDECHKILDKCLKCKLASICQPCVLHSRCSFYPKFYGLIKNA